MSRARFGRTTPAGSPLLGALLREADAADAADAPAIARGLATRLNVERVHLHRSGREALRVLLRSLQRATGRSEVVVPAYTCYSVPAAVVAAGLRVRLVEVDSRGCIDLDDLASQPLESAAAVIVCNLFGLAEPIREIEKLCSRAQVPVVDDAAQALGAADAEGPVGGRGDYGLLSFGRGKPLAALGGGAVAECRARADGLESGVVGPERASAMLRAGLHDLALLPWMFRLLSEIPALEIGVTHFDPEFEQGGISGAALALLGATLTHFDAQCAERARQAEQLAARVRAGSRFEPLTAPPDGCGTYARLGVIAPSQAARDAALASLRAAGLGASGLYPAALDQVAPLAPHRVETRTCAVARDLAARTLTLPTHGRLSERQHVDIVDILAETDGH